MIEYIFNDKVSSVMCYLKYIEDTIEYFNLILVILLKEKK